MCSDWWRLDPWTGTVCCEVEECALWAIMGLQGVQLSLAELSQIGVKRVSVRGALSRAILGAFIRAAREMQANGTFTFADDAVSMSTCRYC